jgi:hypothetical protein
VGALVRSHRFFLRSVDGWIASHESLGEVGSISFLKRCSGRHNEADMSTVQAPPSALPELTRQEAMEFFDQQVRLLLGIGREEFLERLGAGEYVEDEPRIGHLIQLLPFGR